MKFYLSLAILISQLSLFVYAKEDGMGIEALFREHGPCKGGRQSESVLVRCSAGECLICMNELCEPSPYSFEDVFKNFKKKPCAKIWRDGQWKSEKREKNVENVKEDESGAPDRGSSKVVDGVELERLLIAPHGLSGSAAHIYHFNCLLNVFPGEWTCPCCKSLYAKHVQNFLRMASERVMRAEANAAASKRSSGTSKKPSGDSVAAKSDGKESVPEGGLEGVNPTEHAAEGATEDVEESSNDAKKHTTGNRVGCTLTYDFADNVTKVTIETTTPVQALEESENYTDSSVLNNTKEESKPNTNDQEMGANGARTASTATSGSNFTDRKMEQKIAKNTHLLKNSACIELLLADKSRWAPDSDEHYFIHQNTAITSNNISPVEYIVCDALCKKMGGILNFTMLNTSTYTKAIKWLASFVDPTNPARPLSAMLTPVSLHTAINFLARSIISTASTIPDILEDLDYVAKNLQELPFYFIAHGATDVALQTIATSLAMRFDPEAREILNSFKTKLLLAPLLDCNLINNAPATFIDLLKAVIRKYKGDPLGDYIAAILIRSLKVSEQWTDEKIQALRQASFENPVAFCLILLEFSEPLPCSELLHLLNQCISNQLPEATSSAVSSDSPQPSPTEEVSSLFHNLPLSGSSDFKDSENSKKSKDSSKHSAGEAREKNKTFLRQLDILLEYAWSNNKIETPTPEEFKEYKSLIFRLSDALLPHSDLPESADSDSTSEDPKDSNETEEQPCPADSTESTANTATGTKNGTPLQEESPEYGNTETSFVAPEIARSAQLHQELQASLLHLSPFKHEPLCKELNALFSQWEARPSPRRIWYSIEKIESPSLVQTLMQLTLADYIDFFSTNTEVVIRHDS